MTDQNFEINITKIVFSIKIVLTLKTAIHLSITNRQFKLNFEPTLTVMVQPQFRTDLAPILYGPYGIDPNSDNFETGPYLELILTLFRNRP